MLLNYSVKGYKNFYNIATISLVADNYIKKNQENLIKDINKNTNLLKSLFIIGPNNKGKTNLIESIYFLVKILKNGKVFKEDYDKNVNIFYDKNDPIEFHIDFIIDNNKYSYLLSFNEEKVEKEEIYKNNKLIYNKNNYSLDEKLLDLENTEIKKSFINFFNNFELLNMKNEKSLIQILKDQSILYELNELIYKLDLNINKVILNEDETIYLECKFKDLVKFIPLDMKNINSVYKIIYLIVKIIDSNNKNKILLIDDIDLMLHHQVLTAILTYFNEKIENVQLISSTNDILLLDNKFLLRKDQVWFIDSDNENNYLYSLNNFKDNKEIDSRGNVMIKYLKGLFGALPDIKDFL